MLRSLAGACAVSLLVAACSGPAEPAGAGSAASPAASTSPAPASPAAPLDCGLATNAMADYGRAVSDLARSVEANDSMAAIAASDAMLYAIDQLMPVVNAVGDPGRAFAAKAWAVATLVKGGVANETTMQDLLPQLTEAFRDPAFSTGGGAIESYVDQRCASATPGG
ncbi:MAG: hypothetical protein ACKOT0_01885 [bacterium]